MTLSVDNLLDLPTSEVMLKTDLYRADVRRCSRCLYDETMPSIRFDEAGVCNYCAIHDEMAAQYPVGDEGEAALKKLVEQIKQDGKGKKYDCVIGVSGGCDSSYLVYKMVDMGLRPLAVHFDNTWNSPIATQNIYKVLKALDVDLFTIVANNREYDDIYKSFMLSGLKDIEGPTDIAIATTMYKAVEKYGIKYFIDGHSFRTEGISPLGWLYMDGKFIESVHKQYGTVPMKTYPNLTMGRFLKWSIFNSIQRPRPLYYMTYDKEAVKQFLMDEFGWQWYGGHHMENRFTAFYHSYFLPRKVGMDTRLLGHSALVRSGQLTRDEALKQIMEPRECPEEVVALVKKRMNFSDEEFERIITLPDRHYTEFPTYKKTFEALRPVFWLLYQAGRVPKSFYMKYCFPDMTQRK